VDALVTDLNRQAAVAGLRALGRAGLRVAGLAPHWAAAGLWSRYCARRAVAPDAAEDPASFARRAASLAVRHGPLVVYPGGEQAIDALLGSPDMPPEAILPYPSPDVLASLRDKRRLAELAAQAGLRAPAAQTATTAAELTPQSVRLPAVIKPARPGRRTVGARIVRSVDELRTVLATLAAGEPLLVQERVHGPLIVLAVVVGRQGRLVARFQQVGSRTWPAEAGGSSHAVSVRPDEHLVSCALRLLNEAGYFGLAQLDLIETDHGPMLIDVNLRFYDSLPLALACSSNLPAAWHAVATGTPPPALDAYRIGVTYRWLEADLAAAKAGAPRLLLERPRRGSAGAMWAADDPLPGLLLAADAVTIRLQRRLPWRREH
jgi:predicted ATP-grasp superfamily ATP-dependent carboligase